MAYRVFRRPNIDLDAESKSWDHRKAKDIKEGAIVTNAGLVTDVKRYTSNDSAEIVQFKFMSGGIAEYFADSPLYSFQ